MFYARGRKYGAIDVAFYKEELAKTQATTNLKSRSLSALPTYFRKRIPMVKIRIVPPVWADMCDNVVTGQPKITKLLRMDLDLCYKL